jgi:hypothetical protein
MAGACMRWGENPKTKNKQLQFVQVEIIGCVQANKNNNTTLYMPIVRKILSSLMRVCVCV